MAKCRITTPDIAQGRSAVVEVDGQRLLVCRAPGGLHVVIDDCPHQNLTMEGGRVRGTSVICPHHGARFSLEDGRSMSPITPKALTVVPCREMDGELEVDL